MQPFTVSIQEQLTTTFYEWELLGRGWLHAGEPIQLEPPFTPFFGHSIPDLQMVDDAVVPTVLSKVASLFTSNTQQETSQTVDSISYTPFPFGEDSSLIRHALTFPRGFIPNTTAVFSFLTMLSYIKQPVSVELRATSDEIKYYIVCRESDAPYLTLQLKTYFPEIGINTSIELFEHILDTSLPLSTVDFGLEQEFMRPIAMYQAKQPDALVPVLSLCQHLSAGSTILLQVLFTGVINPWTASMLRSVTQTDGKPFFENAPEMVPLVKEKIQTPLFATTMRIAVQSEDSGTASQILDTLCFAIRTQARSLVNTLIPLFTDTYTITQRAMDIAFRQSHRFGMLLNLGELAQFFHFPAYNSAFSKLYSGRRKTKEVPSIAVGNPYSIGINEHNGKSTEVTLSDTQRMKHMHLIGATGTGKSTLIIQLALQDIAKGNGVSVIDPHGDLIEELLARIPPQRHQDVVLVDPSDMEFPVGINIIEAHTDTEKEVLASDLVASFRKHATSWGDQMNAVLANAILALLESPDGGTIHDLRRFLVEQPFRAQVLSTITDPSVLYYWQKEYPFLKTNSIGPILTRLDSFLRPKVIRTMLIQKRGINFSELMQKQRILLVKLPQGLIGAENSYVLGTLVLSKLHQAALSRQNSSNSRYPYYIYIDEFHHFITPSIKEMLTGARKYHIGLIVAHQDITQLQKEDTELMHTVFNTVATRIVFRTGDSDAKKICEGLQSFEPSDIQNLAMGDAVIRIEQPQYDCSLETIAAPYCEEEHRIKNSQHIRALSRKSYATHKSELEAMLLASLSLSTEKEPQSIKKEHTKNEKHQEGTQLSQSYIEVAHTDIPEPEQQTSTHRYLQLLIKRMAESKGFIATIEAPLPDGAGQIDVLLKKDKQQIAVEVSHTTDAEWETHNILKCLHAGIETVFSISGDVKHLKKIRTSFEKEKYELKSQQVHFFTPDTLLEFFNENDVIAAPASEEQIIKGYRVNVTYDVISQEEVTRKRNLIARVISDSIRKKKTK
ncbi:MAG: type IV secretion system DNA-binding domain-containing protein [Chitinophagaceae bacterium]|nr:type IV secretion system DNA-binding domain-containing protein [Chitinophagaceae bacterium]